MTILSEELQNHPGGFQATIPHVIGWLADQVDELEHSIFEWNPETERQVREIAWRSGFVVEETMMGLERGLEFSPRAKRTQA